MVANTATIFVYMKKETIITTLCVIFVGGFAYFGLPMFGPRIEEPSSLPFWETSITEDNELTAFDLVLNQSTYQDAVARFGNRVSLTVYETGDGDIVEGYFRETQVGPFLGRMAFTLNVDDQLIHQVKSQVEPEKARLSRHSNYEVPSELVNDFKDKTLFTLAFIPTQITLTSQDIELRFGKLYMVVDEKIEGKKTGTRHYLYPEKGIDVTIDTDKRSIIQYISPRFFEDKVIVPLGVDIVEIYNEI